MTLFKGDYQEDLNRLSSNTNQKKLLKNGWPFFPNRYIVFYTVRKNLINNYFSIIYPYFLPVATFCGLVAWGGSYRPRNVHPRTRLSDPEISRVSTSKTQKTFTKPTSKLQFCSFLTRQPKMIFLEFRIFKIKHCTVYVY